MQKILIIGANGFTGRRMLIDLSAKTNLYNVTGSSLNKDLSPSSGYCFVQADIRDEQQISNLFEKTQPDIVINTSALSAPDYCEAHREEAWATNVTAVEHIAQYCEKYNSKLIHLSTDFVFDGDTNTLYTETDTPNPVNYYGITKWESEKQIESICSNYAIVRVVVVYGAPLPGQHGNIVQLVANKLKAGEQIQVVSDQWRTPTYVGDISLGIEKLFNHNQNGIFHICGPECITIAMIANRVANFLGLDKSLIIPVTTEQMKEATPRPRFSGLSIEKATHELGYTPHRLEEGLEEMF
ncbi:NAD(P)-dependent oxidoreductase [Bacteroides sp. 519]|uniref:SDR family oxidoreductase n=1 Tax=Bacteroides sp. 519 TaxID=2302937 RepID=UPI0013D4EAAF|nr:NAD(P)-dependent oxidoreductase [Bacteroides sp. 519]NDV60174.1 NAD(P)-dependent oxidoreductase [Bacteroides sp. 519]